MSTGRPETRQQIAQVAELAQVQRDSVRNFFSRPGLLSADARQRVATAVAQVGYRPARRAGSALKGVRVGYELPRHWTTPSPVMAPQLSALVAAVYAKGGELVPFTVQPEVPGVDDVVGGTDAERDDPHLGLQGWHRDYANALAVPTYHEVMKSLKLQAFLVNDLATGDTRLDALRREGVPYVALGEPRDAQGAVSDLHPFVENDNARGIRALADLLRDAGCVKIGHLGFADDGTAVPPARRSAIAAALGDGVPHLAVHYEDSLRPSNPQITQVTTWLDSNSELDAVMCDSDALAYIAHLAAPGADRSPIQDPGGLRDERRTLMIAGNDCSVYRTLVPPEEQWLTMKGDAEKVAEASTELLARLRAGQREDVHLFTPPMLIGIPGQGSSAVLEMD